MSRIAISGSAGSGKTTLARALARALDLPLIEEEARTRLEAGQPPLARLPMEDRVRELSAMWASRRDMETAAPAFVADNGALDFAAYALHHGCVADEADPPLLAGPLARLSRYDAILLLPWGALPYERDGVRGGDRFEELRFHCLLEGLARRAGLSNLHALPDSITAPEARLAWALSVLPRRGGRVALVGAGPGNPDLLTLRARDLLGRAEVVAYDELIPRAILDLAAPGAELLPVGRRHGAGATAYRLHPAVLARARAGLRVVRLKAGDPMVFGRGGEEAEELREAGIPFEIVPGISAALGAAACAGIPLTHRDLASSVTLRTGHAPKAGQGAGQGAGTVVLYMALKKLRENLDHLAAEGRSPDTPAALVVHASRPEQRVIAGTLGSLEAEARAARLAPGAIALAIVGEVAGLHERLHWWRPLQGRRILVGRSRPGASSLAAHLHQLGAEVVEASLADLASPRPPDPCGLDLSVLASSSLAAGLLVDPRLRALPAVAIGPRTEAAARMAGALRVLRAETPSIESAVACVVHHFGARP